MSIAAALIAGGVSGLLNIGKQRRSENFKEDMGEIIPSAQDYTNKEFLNKHTDYIKNILSGAGIDKGEFRNALEGNRWAIDKVRGAAYANKDAIEKAGSIFKGGEARQMGAEIANSSPEYVTPAYGKKGMKLKPKSKFSTKR